VLTQQCNLRCRYCRLPTGRRHHVSWDVLRASIDALLPTAAESIEVTFTGGEPLLAFATLRRAVAHIEKSVGRNRVRWRVLTNGLLLDDEALSFLDGHDFLVNLSFDGTPAAQAHRGAATYARLDCLLGRLPQAYTALFCNRLLVCVTVSPTTLPDLSASVRSLIGRGIASFSISPVVDDLDWEWSRIAEIECEFEKVSGALRHHYESTGEVPLVSFRKPASEPEPSSSEWNCLVAEGQTPTIDVDGRTYGCLRATTTYQPRPSAVLRGAVEALRLGAADAAGFQENLAALPGRAIASGAYRHRDRWHSSGRRCADCEFINRCHVCPLACASVAGWRDMYRVSDFFCAFNLVASGHRDRFPCQPTADDFLSGRVALSGFSSSTQVKRPARSLAPASA
jgi:sulfatase maturation enzyme AslB (radical SAM superfamily)